MSGRGGVVGVDMDGVTQRHANLAPAGVANLLQPGCESLKSLGVRKLPLIIFPDDGDKDGMAEYFEREVKSDV